MSGLDLIIGPLYFLLFLIAAYFFRPFFTIKENKKYFVPALSLKLIAAILLGILYQFYYEGEGGDTFGYFKGANSIWDYFVKNPVDAFRVILWDGEFKNGIYSLISRIPNSQNPEGLLTVQISGFLGLFSFGNYSGIAIIYGVLSFSGAWAFFVAITKLYPEAIKWLALAILFIPSVVFWGSGILKDTITLTAMNWLLWAFINIVYLGKRYIMSIIVIFLCSLLIFSIKKYILIVLLPALILWYYLKTVGKIKSRVVRWILGPIIFILMLISGIGAVNTISIGDSQYSLQNLERTVYVTAHDIRYWTGKEAGSGYSLGDIPSTWQEMLLMSPAAVNVTLFRPYLWEVSNPLMLLASVESTFMLAFSLFLFWKSFRKLPGIIFGDPFLMFSLTFTIVFGFAVGVATWNFGTLIRYKLPLMPLFGCFLAIIVSKLSFNYYNKSRHIVQQQNVN